MSSAGISFGGLASGLDTQAIISALVAVERRPINALETKKSSLGKQKSLFGDLDGLLDKLQAKAKALKTTTDFLKMKVSSDDEDKLTATASGSAAPGSYQVEILRLATAKVSTSAGVASSSADLGSGGEFTLSVGGHDLPISVSTGGASLDAIAAAINSEATSQDLDIRAEVVDTGGAAATRYQLVVRATETGAAGEFTITAVEGHDDFKTLIQGLAASHIADAQDSKIKVNGIEVSRSTNSVSGAIAGVTLDLKATTATNTPLTITVATDATETAKKVQEFVDSYNGIVDFFTTQNALDSEGKAKSPLFGDVTLRSMRSALRTVMGGQVTTSGNNAFEMLSQLGIKADTQGKLTFTQSKLEEALADDEQAVAAVFTDATNGIAKKLETQITLYTDSVDGLLKSRSDSFDRQVKQTQSRIDQSERRLTLYQKQLETKYANLESLLSKLQSQGSSVKNI